MRHVAIALVIGLITIGVSVFILTDSDSTGYQTDLKPDKQVNLGDTYSSSSYDIEFKNFSCQSYTSISDDEKKYGCVLDVEIENTTSFEMLLSLDGDVAIDSSGARYESSDELSRKFINDNNIMSAIGVDQSASGGIFFDVPEGSDIVRLEISEISGAEPIVVFL